MKTGEVNFNQQTQWFYEFFRSGLAGTRTRDQCLKRALLYQLSYQPNRKEAKRSRPAVPLQEFFPWKIALRKRL